MDSYCMSSHILYKTLYDSDETTHGTPIYDFKTVNTPVPLCTASTSYFTEIEQEQKPTIYNTVSSYMFGFDFS